MSNSEFTQPTEAASGWDGGAAWSWETFTKSPIPLKGVVSISFQVGVPCHVSKPLCQVFRGHQTVQHNIFPSPQSLHSSWVKGEYSAVGTQKVMGERKKKVAFHSYEKKGLYGNVLVRQVDEVGIEQERMGYLRQVVQQKQRQGGSKGKEAESTSPIP